MTSDCKRPIDSKQQNSRSIDPLRPNTLDVSQSCNLGQRGSVVRVGDLNAEDPGSNPRHELLNEFVLGDPRGKITTRCK